MRVISSSSPQGLREHYECIRSRAALHDGGSSDCEPRDNFVSRLGERGQHQKHILAKQVAVAGVFTREEAFGAYPSGLYKTTLERVWGGRDRLVQENLTDRDGVLTYKRLDYSSERFTISGGDQYRFEAKETVLAGAEAQAQAQRLESQFHSGWNLPRCKEWLQG